MTLLPDLVVIGLWLALITGVCSLIGLATSRKLLWNPADPLILVLIYVGMNVAIVLVLADASHNAIITYVLLGFGAFLLGLHAFRPARRGGEVAVPLRAPGRATTLLLLGTAAACYLIYDAFIVSQVGFGVFGAANP